MKTPDLRVKKEFQVRVDPKDSLATYRNVVLGVGRRRLRYAMYGLNNSQQDSETDEIDLKTNENSRKLALATGFDQVFELVKRASEQSLGLHRAGLTLILGDLSSEVGAYHEMGSNAIVMNRNILKVVWHSTRSRAKRNAFTFMILLHEYLHTLGFADDAQVRDLCKRISDKFLGEGHVAADMAMKPLDQFFPQIPKYATFRDRGQFETVHRFDSSSTPYIR